MKNKIIIGLIPFILLPSFIFGGFAFFYFGNQYVINNDQGVDIDIEDINYGNVTLEITSSEISELNIPDKSGAYIVDKNTNDLEGYVSEENIINFMSSVVKNIGFAETDEEARSIVNSYLYGYSTSYSDYNGLIY